MPNDIQKSKQELHNMVSSIEPTGRTIAQSTIMSFGTRIPVPIISNFIGLFKDVSDDLAQRNFSKSILDILGTCISEIDDLQETVSNLDKHQKNILGKSLYYTCSAYDNEISDEKKDYLKRLIKFDLLNPDNLNLNTQDIFLILIQDVPAYSLQFLNAVYLKFNTTTFSQADDDVNPKDDNSPEWLKLKSKWLKNSMKNISLNIEIETILEPLILHGLIKQTTVSVINATIYEYKVTEVGKAFIKFTSP